MAGWALGLSFVWCLHPFTLLPSVGLAIAALARSGDDQDHGRKRAIAALIIDGLWVVVFIVLVVTGVVGEFTKDAERDDEGRVTEPSDISAQKLRVGDCANDPNFVDLDRGETVDVYEIEAVPCKVPHDFEAYYAFDLPDGDYPGEQAILREADDKCFREVRGFLGGLKGVAGSLGITYYSPAQLSWKLHDDREVVCVIGDSARKTTGTLRGTGR
jgi:hypothetical protein